MATLAGNAVLDTGQPAALVLFRDWDSHLHVAAVVPGPTGDWTCLVTSGRNYEVTVRGPSGYQPVTDGPLVGAD